MPPKSEIPGPIRVTLDDGRDVVLKRLSNYDRGELLNERYQAQRALLVENLKAASITGGAEFFQTLQEFDSIPRSASVDWVDYCNDGVTDFKVITASLRKTISDPAEVDRIAREITIEFADKAEICGLTLKDPAPTAPPADGLDPETGLPLTYGDSSQETTSPETSSTNG